MPIEVGDSLPSVKLDENLPGQQVDVKDLFKGQLGILISMPGAFTPT